MNEREAWSIPPRPDAPFTGRADELDQLVRTAADARLDGARVVVLVGEPGAGKSRLVAEACARLVGDERVVVGGCVHIAGVPGTQAPLGAFVEALRQVHDVDDGLRAQVQQWIEPHHLDPNDEDPARARSARLLDLLGHLSAQAPLVLVLEDLHWADPSSLELLVFLTRNLTSEAVLLLVTSRPPREGSPVATTLQHLLRRPTVTQLDVGPLTDADVRHILMGCAPDVVSEEQVARIMARAEGNPLAACELATSLAQADGDEPWLPPSFAASVRDRVRVLSPEARTVLAAVAVVGEVTEPTILRAMLATALPGLERPRYTAALAEATESGLICVHESGYAFRHGLERETVYAAIGPDERQWWHAQAAAAWIAHGRGSTPGMAARIASHFDIAGDSEGVRTYSLAAARSAIAMAAFVEASTQFDRVLDAWPVSTSAPEAENGPGCSMLLEAAGAALWAHRTDRCLSLARTAVAAAADTDEADAAREELARLIAESGDSATAVATCEMALSAMHDTRGAAAARTLATQARCYMMLFRYDESARAAQASLACRTDPDDDSRASAWITLGEVTAMTGDPDRGLALMEQGYLHAAAHGHDHELERAVINSSHVLITMGRYREAAERTAATLKTSRRAATRPFLMVNGLDALTHLGRWQHALALLDDVLAQPQTSFGVLWLRPGIAHLHLLRGDRAAAERVLAEARASADVVPDPEQSLSLNLVSALYALEAGDVAIARSAMAEVIAEVASIEQDAQPMIEALALASRVEAEAQRGRPGFDPSNIARLRALLESSRAGLHEHQAHLFFEAARAAAELDRAEGIDRVLTWREVCEQALELRRPHDHAYAQLRLAEVALRTRQRTAALQSLTEAHSTAVRLGAAPLEELVRRTAQRHRLPLDTASSIARTRGANGTAVLGPPATEADGPRDGFFAGDMEPLTERELEVLRLLPAPLSQRELAASLYVSSNTLKVHLRRIYRKLEVASREDAVRRARTLDLL